MKVSTYKEVTLNIYHSLALVKELMNQDYKPVSEDMKVDFKFKKKGFKKLLIFDLDETLIHCKCDEEDFSDEEDLK